MGRGSDTDIPEGEERMSHPERKDLNTHHKRVDENPGVISGEVTAQPRGED